MITDFNKSLYLDGVVIETSEYENICGDFCDYEQRNLIDGGSVQIPSIPIPTDLNENSVPYTVIQ